MSDDIDIEDLFSGGSSGADGGSDSGSSGADDAACVPDCALFASEAEHRLYHLFDAGRADCEVKPPVEAFLRSRVDEDSDLSPSTYIYDADSSFRVVDHLSALLDDEERGRDEQGLRGIIRGDFSISFADGGPAFWLAMVHASPHLSQLVDGARAMLTELQRSVDLHLPGQRLRAWPAAFRVSQETFPTLRFMGFSIEQPVAVVSDLVAMAEAVALFTCAKRGDEPRWCIGGFVFELLLPASGEAKRASGSSLVPGRLFIPAAEEHVAEEARQILDQTRQAQPRRRRRRGRH